MANADIFLRRLGYAVAAATLPSVIVIAVLWITARLDDFGTIVAIVAVMAPNFALWRRHFAGLAALTAQMRRLTGAPADNIMRDDLAGLAPAVEALHRAFLARRGELDALLAANQTLFAAIPQPLILIDAARHVVRGNRAAESLFGEAIAGRDLHAVIRDPAVLEAVETALAGGTPELGALTLSGDIVRHFRTAATRLPAAAGNASVLLSLYDVTEIRQAERMRADFVANVSHELRTPLSALHGFVETLRSSAKDDAAARERFLAIMHEQTQRMTRLVQDLLSLSKIEQSEHTPPTERAEIGRVIGGVLDTVALQAKTRGIAIDVDLAAGLPAVAGDTDQLAQVFQNLIDNAIKYGKPEGKVRIMARAAATAPPRIAAGSASRAGGGGAASWVSIAVADDGEGIPREHLPRLTERFYRVDAARSRQLGGTGLGLAIVKHILNRHRGGLAIESEPGRGSVFTAWLPAAEDVRPSS
ncbi:MAG: PAS domain-containing protein [Proteobacteria bacterium]|nr:PAS domain-containing protein [Pseudomonadota bacterium]